MKRRAAPTPVPRARDADERAADLMFRFARGRRDVVENDEATSLVAVLMAAAVPEFCDGVAVELNVEGSERVRSSSRRASCRQEGSHEECCAPGLQALLDGAVPSTDPRRLVVPITVGTRTTGVVVFVREAGHFADVDAWAAHDVVQAVGGHVDRAAHERASRDAVRQTQRIASQLHQLITVSFTVASLREPRAILLSLAESARGVFNADVASVTYGEERILATRGQRARVAGADELGDELTPPRDVAARDAWLEGEWLVAPILLRRRESRGQIAARRVGPTFGAEDREVVTLLAQVAATALGAAELNQTIRASEERLRVLIQSAPVGIVELDADGAIRRRNPSASRVFGWDVDDDARVTFPLSTTEGFRELWSALGRGAATATREFVDVEIGGRPRFLTASAAVLPDRGILVLVDDVTDHRQLQSTMRHAQTMETRGQVASKIAHDFNNLLTLITGYAEMLAGDVADNERARSMVQGIQATTSRASLLTTQLQSIGRTKAMETVVFSPRAVVQSNAEVLERILGRGIDLTLELDQEVGNVRLDPDEFEQLVLNLALNARDAMPDGGALKITLSSLDLDDSTARARRLAPGPYVQLDVRDTGVGMDEATLARCFDPLFTTKGPFKGTGLGLSAARRFVEDAGGAIWGESEPGEGTRFVTLIPRRDEAARDLSPAPAITRTRASATVLVSEDDESLRALVAQVLRRNGFVVRDVASAEDALALVDEGIDFDLLVSDVMMGEMSGAELAQELQGRHPALRVLLTSGTETSAVLDGLISARSDFLPKPFKPSALIDRVDALMSRRDDV